jgi:hypothetical protein
MGPVDSTVELERADRPWQQGHHQSLSWAREHTQNIAQAPARDGFLVIQIVRERIPQLPSPAVGPRAGMERPFPALVGR